MKTLILTMAIGILLSGPSLADEPSLQEAKTYLESRQTEYLSCTSDADCVVSSDACGNLVAVNQAKLANYQAAARVYGRVIDCPLPSPSPNKTPFCSTGRCQLNER